MLENPAVKEAIVKVASGDGSVQELVAYITLRGLCDTTELKQVLYAEMKERLPVYMVPAFLEVIERIPMLPSGKADRSKLPAPVSPRLSATTGKRVLPQTKLEQALAKAWGEVFGRDDLSVEDDFFTDLGGHSLLAAQVTSNLRRLPALRQLPISAVYAHPTIRALAQHIESLAPQTDKAASNGKAAVARPEPLRHGSGRVWLCGMAQFGMVYVLALFLGLPLAFLLGAGFHPLVALTIAGLLVPPFTLLLPFAAKWLLIGRFRAGRYPLWGWYYCRWWLARKIMAMSPLGYLAGSPFLAPYLRLLGAKIGHGYYHLGKLRLQLPDLLEIADGVSIGYGAAVEPYAVQDGWLIMGPIRIGRDAYIGVNSVVMLGGSVGDGACVMEQSLVAQGQAIPANETWAGSPSRRVANDPVLDKMAASKAPERWSARLVAGFVGAFIFS